jgi:acetyltransferase-like isoleucine patch superfamily enzyme
MGRLADPHFRWATAGKLMRPWWRRRFHAFGDGSILSNADWIFRPDRIAIGRDVWIGPHAWFEVSATALEREGPLIELGDGVVLRHHVTISAAEHVVVEDEVLIAAYTSIYDADHTIGERGNPIWHPQRTAPVRIGRGSWLGERVAVLRGADIGSHCIIGANSVVKGTIPDYSVAVGAPARVVGSTREMASGR